MFAVINRWLANGALIATVLRPLRIQPSPSRSAVVVTSCQRSPDSGSPAASATIAVPSTTFSSSDAACSPRRVAEVLRRPPPVDIGFDHQSVAERLGDDHEFDWATADSAHLLRQGGAEDAELVGERPPDLRLPAGAGLGRGAALLQVVTGRQELGQPVAKQFLFLAQVEVHL